MLTSQYSCDEDDFIVLEKVRDQMSVDICIDLSSYLHAYRQQCNGDRSAAYIFNTIRAKITNETSPHSIKGATLLPNLIEIATENQFKLKEIIEKTSAYFFMADSLVEIVKNAIDESLQHALDSHAEIVRTTVRVDIEFDDSLDKIAITCTDQGRGFSPILIETLNSSKNRASYLKRHGSDKAMQTGGINCFFGGRGRGLRDLIAKVEGDKGLTQHATYHFFKKPKYSTLQCFNNQGAAVKVTTSTEEVVLNDENGCESIQHVPPLKNSINYDC